MSKIWKIRQWIGFIIVLIACSSCDDGLPQQEKESGGRLTLSLCMPPELTVQTKTSLTEHITINDVWIFQYTGDSPAAPLHVQHVTESSKITDMHDKGESIKENYMIQVETEGFSDVDSRFYVIVNADNDLDEKLNKYSQNESNIAESDLKAETMAISNVPQNEIGFLTSGPIDYKQKSVTEGENIDPSAESSVKAIIDVPLRRAYAKITLKKSENSSKNFTPGSILITNYPSVMAVAVCGGDEAAGATYPMTSNGSTAEVTNNWNGNPLSFYMGENLRGTGTGSSMADKAKAQYGPRGSLDNCTYIDINGTYKYESSYDAVGVSYRIYLGGNLLNDYNIQRGYSYNLTINVGGANSADVRVTITDGNVVVFDKTETVNKTITF